METRADFCPLCQGQKVVRNVADFEIIAETCWVCGGVGKVLTKPVPQRPKKVEMVGLRPAFSMERGTRR